MAGTSFIEAEDSLTGFGYYQYEITSTFAVRDFLYDCQETDCGYDWPDGGVELVYAGPHCHAPSCLGMELYNDDSGEVLCSMKPIYGTGDPEDKFDEKGYAALPPCLWGDGAGDDEDAVLPQRPFLSFGTNLRSVAKQNSTFGHFGQMASWQMRGVLRNSTSGVE